MGFMRDVPGTGAYEEAVLDAAIESLLWSETDNSDESGGQPLDQNYCAECVTAESRRLLQSNILACLETEGVEERITRNNISAGQFGHDFIMSANGHGCGFWDRGYGDDGDWLHELVKPYGSIAAYVNDRGLIEISI